MAFNDKGKSRRNTGREETQGELMQAAALILTDRQTSDCHWAMREEAHLSELKPLMEMQAQVQEANMHQWRSTDRRQGKQDSAISAEAKDTWHSTTQRTSDRHVQPQTNEKRRKRNGLG
jgi:hypothetical protein